MDEQFTMHRSRAEEITIAEHIPSSSGRFGLEDEFNAMENEFGEEMMDFELPRQSPRVTFADESHQSDILMLPKGDDGADITLPSRRLSKDQGRDLNDLGGPNLFDNEFGMDDGGLPTNFDVLGVDDINISTAEKDQEQSTAAPENEAAMEVDQPAHDETLHAEPEGFVLEPVDTIGTKKRPKKKRKLLVDYVTELSSDVIRANLDDPSDTLVPKCFPPPTKKALLWKEAASCEQLFSRPTLPFMVPEVASLITRNFVLHPPVQPSKNIIDLEPDIEAKRGADTTADTLANDTAVALPELDQSNPNASAADKDATLMEAPVFDDLQDMAMGGDLLNMQDDEQVTKVIPELPDLEEPDSVPPNQTTEEQESGEAGGEEFERRRWTKRTQQVMRMMERGLSQQDEINFKSLTKKCGRKQAAARFYTCLLLTKEGAIKVRQEEAYGDIYIQRGSHATEAV